jgi:tRNA A37 methylthiotransferase MiaB
MKLGLVSLGCPKNLVDSEVMLGLIREKAPRLFEVAYYTVTVKDGKITDITG